MALKFAWDEEKNIINKQKHKISFETAAHVFCDPYYIVIYDYKNSLEEDRYIAIGKAKAILFVVYTERRNYIRIISARLATKAERRCYYERILYS